MHNAPADAWGSCWAWGRPAGMLNRTGTGQSVLSAGYVPASAVGRLTILPSDCPGPGQSIICFDNPVNAQCCTSRSCDEAPTLDMAAVFVKPAGVSDAASLADAVSCFRHPVRLCMPALHQHPGWRQSGASAQPPGRHADSAAMCCLPCAQPRLLLGPGGRWQTTRRPPGWSLTPTSTWAAPTRWWRQGRTPTTAPTLLMRYGCGEALSPWHGS